MHAKRVSVKMTLYTNLYTEPPERFSIRLPGREGGAQLKAGYLRFISSVALSYSQIYISGFVFVSKDTFLDMCTMVKIKKNNKINGRWKELTLPTSRLLRPRPARKDAEACWGRLGGASPRCSSSAESAKAFIDCLKGAG